MFLVSFALTHIKHYFLRKSERECPAPLNRFSIYVRTLYQRKGVVDGADFYWQSLNQRVYRKCVVVSVTRIFAHQTPHK